MRFRKWDTSRPISLYHIISVTNPYQRWHYVLGAGLTQSFTIHNADLELQNVFSVAIDYFAFTSGTQAVAPFDNEHDLVIPNGQATLSILLYLSPLSSP